jgi:hypothetical protein
MCVAVSQRGNILDGGLHYVHYRNGYWKTVKSRHKFTLETCVLFVLTVVARIIFKTKLRPFVVWKCFICGVLLNTPTLVAAVFT